LKLRSAEIGRDQCIYFRRVACAGQVLGDQGRARAARELPGGAAGWNCCRSRGQHGAAGGAERRAAMNTKRSELRGKLETARHKLRRAGGSWAEAAPESGSGAARRKQARGSWRVLRPCGGSGCWRAENRALQKEGGERALDEGREPLLGKPQPSRVRRDRPKTQAQLKFSRQRGHRRAADRVG
jgi:hypothetical protein